MNSSEEFLNMTAQIAYPQRQNAAQPNMTIAIIAPCERAIVVSGEVGGATLGDGDGGDERWSERNDRVDMVVDIYGEVGVDDSDDDNEVSSGEYLLVLEVVSLILLEEESCKRANRSPPSIATI